MINQKYCWNQVEVWQSKPKQMIIPYFSAKLSVAVVMSLTGLRICHTTCHTNKCAKIMTMSYSNKDVCLLTCYLVMSVMFAAWWNNLTNLQHFIPNSNMWGPNVQNALDLKKSESRDFLEFSKISKLTTI